MVSVCTSGVLRDETVLVRRKAQDQFRLTSNCWHYSEASMLVMWCVMHPAWETFLGSCKTEKLFVLRVRVSTGLLAAQLETIFARRGGGFSLSIQVSTTVVQGSCRSCRRLPPPISRTRWAHFILSRIWSRSQQWTPSCARPFHHSVFHLLPPVHQTSTFHATI